MARGFGDILKFILPVFMVLQASIQPLILLDYEVRKDYFAEVLCINKEKPELACEGKCILSQKLKDQTEKEEQTKTENMHFPVTFQEANGTSFFGTLSDADFLKNPNRSSFILSSLENKLFRPPRSLSLIS
jgi:hypothetical protein